MKYKITIAKYKHETSINTAKGLAWPHLRGTWIPCIDEQIGGKEKKFAPIGIAFNWLWLRVKVIERSVTANSHRNSGSGLT